MVAQSRSAGLRQFAVPLTILTVGTAIAVVNWTTHLTSEVLLPQFGHSAQAVMGRGVVGLTLGGLVVWLLLSKQVSRRGKGYVLGALLLVLVTLAASIRQIENTGSNNYVVHFRWQPTQDQRLARYQQAPPATAGAGKLDTAAATFTDFLGPGRDGIVAGAKLVTDLSNRAPGEIWRRPVGSGYAGCVLSGGLAVTIEQRGEQEVVVAYDLQTGADRWARGYAGHFKESLGGDGPRATPTIAGDQVFALGANGLLVALDLASGTELWKIDILTDAGTKNVKWGMSGAPLVVDNLVIVNPGGQDGLGVIAYDRSNGDRMWSGGSSQAGYASPVVATLHGRRQVLIFDAAGVAGYDLHDGSELWRFPFASFNGINVGQPLALPGERVFISAGYDSGAVMLRIESGEEGWTATPVWRNKRLKCKMGSAIYHAGYLYGLDDGILACLDADTGDRLWKGGRYGHGQMLLRDDVLVIQAESGDLVLVAADPQRHRELARLPMLPGGKTWNAPALADNLLLLRNHFEAVLLELPTID